MLQKNDGNFIDYKNIPLTQAEVDKINKGIPFVDAKIFWKEGFGWTSKYWYILYTEGWRMKLSEEEPGLICVVDEGGKTILSDDNEVGLFKLLVNFMVGGG